MLPLLHCAGQLYATRSTKPTSPHPTPPPPGYAFITRILHSSRAGAGRGRDDGRAPQPGAGSARLRRAWCRYHCWRKETRASSRPWRHSRTARVDDRTQHLPYQEALDQTSALPSPTPSGYALPIPGVNHVRISGDDHPRCCCGRLARWQCAAPAVPTRAEWVVLRAHYARVAQFGVRQPCCRASRACDHGRVAAVAVRATGTTGVQRISGWFDHPHYHILTKTVPHRRKPWATAQGVGRGRGAGEKPAHQRPRQHLPAVARMLARRLEACTTGSRHGERVQPVLTQRDMWVMHSLQRERAGVEGCSWKLGARASGSLRVECAPAPSAMHYP